MKKFGVLLLLIALIAAIVFFFGNHAEQPTAQTAYLRIHIRANSNLEQDQTVKYEVRDAVCQFLTPLVAECEEKAEAMQTVKKNLDEIARVAQNVLQKKGYLYGAKAHLRQEQFPTRVYEGVTLSAGVYDALILELGSARGDNWWCVVYPPLCFASGNGNFVYKSKIAEIIKDFFA